MTSGKWIRLVCFLLLGVFIGKLILSEEYLIAATVLLLSIILVEQSIESQEK